MLIFVTFKCDAVTYGRYTHLAINHKFMQQPTYYLLYTGVFRQNQNHVATNPDQILLHARLFFVHNFSTYSLSLNSKTLWVSRTKWPTPLTFYKIHVRVPGDCHQGKRSRGGEAVV